MAAGRPGRRAGSLAARLVGGFADLGCPALMVAMDSPDMTVADLAQGCPALADGTGAVLGPAADGGYWVIGLGRACPGALAGVPMRRPGLARQRARLDEFGLWRIEMRTLPDVDTFADAVAVAGRRPDTPLAAAMASVQTRLGRTAAAR